jgi:hypothetical protein
VVAAQQFSFPNSITSKENPRGKWDMSSLNFLIFGLAVLFRQNNGNLASFSDPAF